MRKREELSSCPAQEFPGFPEPREQSPDEGQIFGYRSEGLVRQGSARTSSAGEDGTPRPGPRRQASRRRGEPGFQRKQGLQREGRVFS